MRVKRILCGMIGCIGLLTMSYGYVFSDLTEAHWAYYIVTEMHEKGIISGFYDGTFKPEDYVTKEQFATLLYKVLEPSDEGKMSFADVTPDYWSKAYVDVMGQYMEYEEYEGKRYFNPSGFVRRESVAMALGKAMKFSGKPDMALLDGFTDKQQIATDAQSAVALCIANGIMKGNADGTFNPKGYLKRAEISALLNNVLGLLETQAEELPSEEWEEPNNPSSNVDEEQSDENVKNPVSEIEDEPFKEPDPNLEEKLPDEDESIPVKGLNVWNGLYENEEATVKLYRIATDRLGVLVLKDMRVNFFEMVLNSAEYLVDEIAFFDNVTKRTLTKTADGIQLQIHSTQATEWEEEVSGSYKSMNTDHYGWDGVYRCGQNELILAELGEEIRIQLKGSFGEFGAYSQDYSKEQIRSKEAAIGAVERIVIKREAEGIYVTATKDGSTLEQLSGLYQLVD